MKSTTSRLSPARKKKPSPLKVLLTPIFDAIIRFLTLIGGIVRKAYVAVVEFLKPFMQFLTRFVLSLHHRLGSLFPFHTREKLEELFLYSGITRNPEESLGMVMMYSIILPIAAGLVTYIQTKGAPLMTLIVAGSCFGGVWIVLYMVLNVLIDKRTSNIEKVLPDMLSMISQNMSAGMTPYNALWIAAKPEFGILAQEIQQASRETLTGTPLETALINMANRVRSHRLQRTIKLMVQGMRSGGELPKVLQEISRDIRKEQNLIKTMESETTSQVMFILFALIIGAPLLFAASSQFIGIFSSTLANIDVGEMSEQTQGSSMISMSELPINEAEFTSYAIKILVSCSILGSLLMGLMRAGKVTKGVTLIPITIVLSVGIFLLLKQILSSVFQGMMV